MTYNTFVLNRGLGQPPSAVSDSTGGDILIVFPRDSRDIYLEGNIFSQTVTGCGIRIYGYPPATPSSIPGVLRLVAATNVFWGVRPRLFTSVRQAERQIIEATMIIADPRFCNFAYDDFRLFPDSPAIVGGTPLGAFDEIGCAGSQSPGPGRPHH